MVDDDVLLARAVARVLRPLAPVRVVHDAAALEAALASGQPPLFAILDVHLDGARTAYSVVANHEVMCPVVFMTGHQDRAFEFLAQTNRYGPLVPKSVGAHAREGLPAHLLHALRRQLGASHYRRIGLLSRLRSWYDDPLWTVEGFRRRLAALMVGDVDRSEWDVAFPELSNRKSLDYRVRKTLEPFGVGTVEQLRAKLEHEGRLAFDAVAST